MTEARLEERRQLSSDELAAVLELVHAVTDADGAVPLSDHSMLHLRYGGDGHVRNLLLWSPEGMLAGYGQLDLADRVEGPAAEVAVHPDQRRRGYGRTLVERLRSWSPDGRLRLWAHGRQAAAEALALGMGFERTRVLRQMRRSLRSPLGRPDLAADITVRPFRPGQDEQAWTELNARAFADHPEQGRWTTEDLLHREQADWFDPAGFLLAEQDGHLVGFVWTKVHGENLHAHQAIGEIYVLGVDPGLAGHGLGTALTLAGLRQLRGQGLAEAMLYVDEGNPKAIALYERLGFTTWDVDVSFQLR